MTAPTASLHRIPGAGVFDPFSLAAYATWSAVALGAAGQLTRGAPLSAATLVGLVGLAGMLALFVLRAQMDARALSLRPRQAAVLGQLGCTLLACWGLSAGLRFEFAPALLVIVAAQLPVVFPLRAVILLLLAANSVLAGVLIEAAGGFHGTLKLLSWAGFQGFSVIGCGFAMQLQQMGLAALRINAELIATRQLVEEGARVEERLRLSRELHDVAGHKLTALKMQLALHRRERPDMSALALEESARLADELLADIRGVVSTLRVHEGVDLPRALRALDPGLPRPHTIFEIDPQLRVADMRRADALLRCAQEALTNALRHSAASTVWVRLGVEDAGLVLTVADDGRGRREALSMGNGLRGMQERLAEVGGCLQLQDRSPRGLSLRAILPDPMAAVEPALDVAKVSAAGAWKWRC